MSGVGPKFKRMAELYRRFGEGWSGLDWSEQALVDAYNGESYGSPTKHELMENRNGYYWGKHWMDVTVAMWREDRRRGELPLKDLYDEYPHWWLDRVLEK